MPDLRCCNRYVVVTSSRSSTPRVEYTADPVTVRDEAVSLYAPCVPLHTGERT